LQGVNKVGIKKNNCSTIFIQKKTSIPDASFSSPSHKRRIWKD